jgi:hypothetical protein
MKGKGGFFGPPEAGAEVRADQNFRLLCPQLAFLSLFHSAFRLVSFLFSNAPT